MNAKMKRRMVVVSGIIVIVIIVVLAVVGGSTAAKTVSVAEAAEGSYATQKIQVSGNVVDNSFSTEGTVLSFDIYDTDGDPSAQVHVRYEGGVSATFGNGVTAICTGTMGEDGTLNCTELVTKCPSKYENSSDALTAAKLIEYGEGIADKPVKVTGNVKAGTLVAAGADERFVLVDADGAAEVSVRYDGAIPDAVTEGTALVLTGSIGTDGVFTATDVALEG